MKKDYLQVIINWASIYNLEYEYEILNHVFMAWCTYEKPRPFKEVGVPQNRELLLELQEMYIECSYLDYIPKEVAMLPNLKYIHIINTQIKSIPNEILSMKNLEEITITGNKQLKLTTTNIKYLKKLYTYGLSEEMEWQIADEWMKVLWRWAKKFNVKGENTWDGVKLGIPMDRTTLIRMDELMLKGKYLTSVPKELQHLTNLVYLAIVETTLKELPQGVLSLPKLKTLWLLKNRYFNVPKTITLADSKNPGVKIKVEMFGSNGEHINFYK